MPLSKNRIKYIHSLNLKKNRKSEGVFLAEGTKLVSDLLGHFHCRFLVATSEWLSQQHLSAPLPIEEVIVASANEMSQASLQKSPQQVLAVFEQPTFSADIPSVKQSLCLALDSIQDPGNLGTIIRLADWFGIKDIFCSPETVDVYNPKTVQATMGGIARVRVHYLALQNLIEACGDIPVYGTFLEGENIYTQELTAHGLIIMGNEGNGISQELKPLIKQKLFIPNYPIGSETSESLNVAIATAIVCAEFRRQISSR